MTGDLMAALRESLDAAKRRRGPTARPPEEEWIPEQGGTLHEEQRRILAGPCAHPSADGDEGPVADLGRMPTRWRCHACGQVFEDPAGEAEAGGP